MAFSLNQKAEFQIKFGQECKDWIGGVFGPKCDPVTFLQRPNKIWLIVGLQNLSEDERTCLEEKVMQNFISRDRTWSTVKSVEFRGALKFESREMPEYYGLQ